MELTGSLGMGSNHSQVFKDACTQTKRADGGGRLQNRFFLLPKPCSSRLTLHPFAKFSCFFFFSFFFFFGLGDILTPLTERERELVLEGVD